MTRDDAIRTFYGPISSREDFELKLLCHLWYSPDTGRCLAYEPEDESYVCVSKPTQRTALFGREE